MAVLALSAQRDEGIEPTTVRGDAGEAGERAVLGQRELDVATISSAHLSAALCTTGAMAGRMPGTIALKVVADDETGEVEGVTMLSEFGEVPDDFVDGLKGD